MVFLDKYNWPVVTINGRWLLNFFRLLLYTRSIRRGYWDGYRITDTYWRCTSCGCIKFKEEEVGCWECGKGEMTYRGKECVVKNENERGRK